MEDKRILVKELSRLCDYGICKDLDDALYWLELCMMTKGALSIIDEIEFSGEDRNWYYPFIEGAIFSKMSDIELLIENGYTVDEIHKISGVPLETLKDFYEEMTHLNHGAPQA